MVKKYDKEKLENNILEFVDTLYVLNPKNSNATISLPFTPVTKLNWTKATKLKITVEELK